MKACREFKRKMKFKRVTPYEDDISIVPADDPRDAWVEWYWAGECVYREFHPGLYYKYLKFLLRKKRCREEIGIDKKTIKEMIKDVEAGYAPLLEDP